MDDLDERDAALLFREGIFFFHRGEYSNALPSLAAAARVFSDQEAWEDVLECKITTIRILIEREDFLQLQIDEAEVLAILRSEKIGYSLRSKAYYILGVLESSRNLEGIHLGLESFNHAIDLAVASGERLPLAFAIYGNSAAQYTLGLFDLAEINLEKLDAILQVEAISQLECSAHLIRSYIAKANGELELALQHTWSAISKIRAEPNLVLYLQALLNLGTIYALKRRFHDSRLYLELAERSFSEKELPRLSRVIRQALEKTAMGSAHVKTSLQFDPSTARVWMGKREIDFGSQFLLRDLIRLLMTNAERTVSKEELVQTLWGEEYSPLRHDNRVYVTIRRLRRLIDLNDGASLVMKVKGGYRIKIGKSLT